MGNKNNANGTVKNSVKVSNAITGGREWKKTIKNQIEISQNPVK